MEKEVGWTDKKKENHARSFFLYLLHFFSLGFVAFGVGGIVFQYINKFFPESLLDAFQGSFEQGAVKFGIASLFVAGPMFFFSALVIGKQLFAGKISNDSTVRRWMTYIVLFFAAGTIIGDLIVLIVNFLEGDIAVKFLLKVLTVLVIAGSIFEYYFWDVRRGEIKGKRYKQDRISFWISLATVIIIFIAGFFIIDSPNVSRNKKIDLQTVNNLQNVANNVRGYYNQSGKLPENIEQLKNTNFAPYLQGDDRVEYKRTGETTFQVCSDFILSNFSQDDGRTMNEYYNEDWTHDAGRVCFDRIVLEQAGNKPTIAR